MRWPTLAQFVDILRLATDDWMLAWVLGIEATVLVVAFVYERVTWKRYLKRMGMLP